MIFKELVDSIKKTDLHSTKWFACPLISSLEVKIVKYRSIIGYKFDITMSEEDALFKVIESIHDRLLKLYDEFQSLLELNIFSHRANCHCIE